MSIEEHETQISFDYAEQIVRIYTTREGVKNGVLRRLGDQESVTCFGNGPWNLTVPMSMCRGPQLIVKLLNPEEKTPMTEKQKAALRAA